MYTGVYTMLETKIARYGNSLTVRLPSAIARELGLREGDRVTLRRRDDSLIIERPLRARLSARLATVKHPEPEIGCGRALGAEHFE